MICKYLGSVIPGESYAWIRVGWRGFSGLAADWLAEQPPTNQGPVCGIPGGPAWVLAWRSLGDPVSWTCRLSISSVTVIIMYCCVEPAYICVYKLHVTWSSICILYAHQQLVEIKIYIYTYIYHNLCSWWPLRLNSRHSSNDTYLSMKPDI